MGFAIRALKHHRFLDATRIAVGLSAQETAQAMGSTEGAVRVTQHRAPNQLSEAVAVGPYR